MNIREAILKAADQIAARPDLFNFSSIEVPRGLCGTPGCAVGWIVYFVGDSVRDGDTWSPGRVGIGDEGVFYTRMDELTDGQWKWTASVCATALRAYADKYHPAEARGIPSSVLAIFETKQTEAVLLPSG